MVYKLEEENHFIVEIVYPIIIFCNGFKPNLNFIDATVWPMEENRRLWNLARGRCSWKT